MVSVGAQVQLQKCLEKSSRAHGASPPDEAVVLSQVGHIMDKRKCVKTLSIANKDQQASARLETQHSVRQSIHLFFYRLRSLVIPYLPVSISSSSERARILQLSSFKLNAGVDHSTEGL